jgi:hypothetical protein
MEKIINLLINNWTKGVDTYTHNGSTWLIFSESKQWVIELTESKTLWYNYSFFKELFSLTSMDVVDNQHYITKWVEDNVMNKVKETDYKSLLKRGSVEDTIENGVTETNHVDVMNFFDNKMEDTLENGVKDTQSNPYEIKSWIDGVIKGGVKETRLEQNITEGEVEEIIENDVKETIECDWNIPKSVINDVISEGVKSSVPRQYVGGDIVDKVIDKGIIETHDDAHHHKDRIDGVIKNGIKETKTPGNGDIVSTVEWLKENNSNSYPKMIDDVIDNGEKINGTYAGGQRQSEKCKSVVEYGTKNPSV